MAFWSNWFRRKEQKYDSLDLFREIYGGRASSSGVSVNWQNSLEFATVLACCRVIGEGVAQVPWKVYRDNGNMDRQSASDHPLYQVIYRRPNRWQTSFGFRETIAFHLCLFGNAYVFKGMVGRDRSVKELIPLEPQFMTASRKKDSETVEYRYVPAEGTAVTFTEDSIWHIRAASWNAWLGLDSVRMMRDAVGLAISAQNAHADHHRGGSRVSGIYSVDGPLSKERYETLAGWLDKYAMGGERAGKPLILDLGAKFTSQQMTGVDAQHIETRDHQIQEICRAFRVMPLMVGFSDKTSTYASAEQFFIAHVVHTLSPWYERLEQSADVNLLSEADQAAGFYTKFNPNALMRGAAKDRAEFYTRAIGSVNASPGWMTQNEIRALEELPPMDGGDEIFKPSPKPAAAQPPGSAGA